MVAAGGAARQQQLAIAICVDTRTISGVSPAHIGYKPLSQEIVQRFAPVARHASSFAPCGDAC